MDSALRNGIWNVLYVYDFHHVAKRSLDDSFLPLLWADYLKQPLDEIPYLGYEAVAKVKRYFNEEPWHKIYSLAEYAIKSHPTASIRQSISDGLALILEKEKAAYRVIGDHIVPVTSGVEVASVENAIGLNDPFSGARTHMEAAVALFADRGSPDYRNSIKESISAVESACAVITGGKATLGAALKKLEGSVPLHQAFKDALSKMYGFTNDSSGIRHALLEASTVGPADAKFFLIICSAFVNYLVEAHSMNKD